LEHAPRQSHSPRTVKPEIFDKTFTEENPLFRPAEALNACGLDVHFATRYADDANDPKRGEVWQEGLRIVDRGRHDIVIEMWFANGVQQPYTALEDTILAQVPKPSFEAIESLATGVAAVYEAGTPEGTQPSPSLLERSPQTAIFQMLDVVEQAARWRLPLGL